MYISLVLFFANFVLGYDHDPRENFSSRFGFAKYNISKRLKEDVPERSLLAFNKLYHPLEPYCTKPAKCEPLRFHTCMGVKLPYSYTTLELVDDLASQEQAQEQLEEWRKIIHIPKCWAVVQPFLCSLFMPRCEDGKVYLPSMEMCNVTLGPCRVLVTYENWPSVFMCKNESRYRTKCKNDFRELKFNTTGKCLEPLVQTELPAYHYEGVEGCGIQCDDPMFTAHQRDQIHKMVAWAATTCALNNLFAVLTFMIDWKFSNKYPALAIFYINLCFFIVCVGWLAQFMPGGREDIVCRKDGTLRLAEPSAGENLSCVVVYVMVYYFLMAGVLWFVILTYAWNLSLQALGKIQERIDKKGAYFHMVAWSLPLVLTITTMALGEIDGNSVTGICFVGNANSEYRAGFLLLPIAAALITGTYFLLKGLYTLIRLKLESEEIISQRASAKIKETILRVGLFSVLVITFGATTFICHIYEFRNQELWAKSFRTFILCRLGIRSVDESHEECRMSSRPSLAMLQLHILSLFVTGILMSTWVWTQNTLNTWTRYLAKVFNRKIESAAQVQAKPQKHKLIAQAYSKRKLGMNEDGVCLSLNLDVSHEDPVGLGIELYSGHSGSVRSSWAAALPKLMTRRDAFVPHTNSSSSIRRNSVDSQISYSVRRVSVESRRHSVDSEVSVKVSEVTQTVVKKVSTPLHKHRMHRGGRGSRKYSKYKSKRSSKHNRNSASASSNDSNIAFQQLMLALADSGGAGTSSQSNLKAFGFNGVSRPKLGRRKANAGLENINSLALLADKLMKHRKSTSSSSSDKTAKSSHPNLDILKDIYGESDVNKSRHKSDPSD